MTDDAARHARIGELEGKLAALRRSIEEARSMLAEDSINEVDRQFEGCASAIDALAYPRPTDPTAARRWEAQLEARRYLEQRAGLTVGAVLLGAFGLFVAAMSLWLAIHISSVG